MVAVADFRMQPDELLAGATRFAGHAETLNTHVQTVNGVAGDLPAAFAGFDAALAPNVASLRQLGDGVGQLSQQVQDLGSSLGQFGAQAPEVDQRGRQALIG